MPSGPTNHPLCNNNSLFRSVCWYGVHSHTQLFVVRYIWEDNQTRRKPYSRPNLSKHKIPARTHCPSCWTLYSCVSFPTSFYLLYHQIPSLWIRPAKLGSKHWNRKLYNGKARVVRNYINSVQNVALRKLSWRKYLPSQWSLASKCHSSASFHKAASAGWMLCFTFARFAGRREQWKAGLRNCFTSFWASVCSMMISSNSSSTLSKLIDPQGCEMQTTMFTWKLKALCMKNASRTLWWKELGRTHVLLCSRNTCSSFIIQKQN